MKIVNKNEKLKVAKNMPPLFHTKPGERFELKNSEVVNWLIEQPEILQFIFDRVRNKGSEKCLIEYDPISKKWRGVNYGK